MLENFEANGDTIKTEELRVAKAVDLVATIGKIPYVRLVECKRVDEQSEVVVLEVEVELPRIKVYDIRRDERIAVCFDPTDSEQPEVLAVRRDFPEVPHLNLRLFEFPRSLCLFEEPYEEIKLRWTPTFLLNRIREWLALTAKGQLHQDDQPLEPLLGNPDGNIVLPDELFQPDGTKIHASYIAHRYGERNTLIVKGLTAESINDEPNDKLSSVLVLEGEPQQHGVISKNPRSIPALSSLVDKAGIHLLKELRNRCAALANNKPYSTVLNSYLIIVLILPKKRRADRQSEDTDTWVFLCPHTILEIGEKIGVWEVRNGEPGILLEYDINRGGEELNIALFKPHRAFSQEYASVLNGLPEPFINTQISLVGTGALGSQICVNLTKCGIGKWALFDYDILLPHNFARHALPYNDFLVGSKKVKALEIFVNNDISFKPIVNTFDIDVVRSHNSEDEVQKSFENADVILDCSTSIAVARYLALDVKTNARMISAFLNPVGSDLVVLIEDKNRETPLDLLEMQYYRHLINQPEYSNHLRRPNERVRYAIGCRDITSRIPQNSVAIHAGIGSRVFQNSLDNPDSKIGIWQINEQDLSVSCDLFPAPVLIAENVGEWKIRTDEALINKLLGERNEKLPSETGGVLVGSFDTSRKIVYMIDSLSSPPDSIEWPNLYIRGFKGLSEKLQIIQQITMNNLEYVGEWHSHPKGSDSRPSSTDWQASEMLSGIMNQDMLPSLMVIVGDKHELSFVLCEEDKVIVKTIFC